MLRAWLLVYPFLAVYVTLGALVGVPYTWLTGRIGLLYWISRQGCLLALRLSGVRLRTEHLDRAFASQPAVFVANHVSNLEPAALFGVLPRVAFMLKRELGRIPVLGYVMGLGSFIYVDRRDKDSRHKALEQGVAALGKGVSLMIFPEGTRSPDGKLLPFRPGPFTMAIEAEAAVVPVTVLGARNLMRKGSMAIKPGEMTLVFHAPIETRGMTAADRSTLMERARRAIESGLDRS